MNNKDHYKYYYEDLNEAKNYINHGIIPRGYRKDRFRAKYANVTVDPSNTEKLRYNNKLIVYQEDIPETVKAIYTDPNFGLINPDSLYSKMRQVMVGVTREQVKREVNKLDIYQVHKPITRQKVRKAILTSRPNTHWQIDLTSMPQHQGYKYIIVIIDIFSKFIYTKAIKNKTSRHVIAFLREVFEIAKPRILQSDRGTEFVNDDMTRFLDEESVKQVLSKAYTPTSQSYVERTNRTIKGMLFKGMTAHNTNNWPSLLAAITNNYNNTNHSSIDMTPDQLTDANEVTVKAVSKDLKWKAKKSLIKHHRNFTKIEKGDLVRMQIKLNVPNSTFAKFYTTNWSEEIYQVEGIKRGNKTTEESYLVNGSYHYRNTLQRVPYANRRVRVFKRSTNRWVFGTIVKKNAKDKRFLVYLENDEEKWIKYNPEKFVLVN